MIHHSLAVMAALLALVACGKAQSDHGPTPEPKLAEGGPSNTSPTASKTIDKPAAPPTKAPSRGDERAVYSLVDNRLSAHLTRGGGLVIPAGSAAFAKYTRFGSLIKGGKKAWDLRQTEGDIKVARLTGKSGSVFVPLSAAQAKATFPSPRSEPTSIVRMRVFSKGEGAVSLKVNDQKEINSKLSDGWSTLELLVPQGQLKEGENALALFAKPAGAAVAWIQVGGSAPIADTGATAFYDAARKALLIPRDTTLSWYAMVPEAGRLTGDLSDGNCTINALVTAEDGASVEGKLNGLGSAIEVSALAGKAVRLDLVGTGCAEAALSNAAIVVPGAAPAVKRGEPPKYVVYIIMDSLRADRVRAFHAKARPESPNFDKLAASSTLFLQNYVQGNESQVSHASMWSSSYLAKHQSIAMKDILAEKWMTIDEVARKGGMFVAGVSANGYIRPARGFGNAWDKYVNHIEKSLGLKGADILEKGLGFVTPRKDRPWFLYLGLIDTHVTWRAKQPWMDKYDGGYQGRFETSYGDDGPGGSNGKDLTDREKDHVRALYDSNVSYQDDLLGQLIAKLEAWGIYDQTMVIITADHGDEQWEDGRVGHGGSVNETLLHVPLVIHYPPMFPAARISAGTEGIDIVPTLADALGVAIDPEWQGASLIPLANGHGGYPLMSFSSKYENGHAGRIAHWKVVLSGAGAPQVYELAKDRGETSDLWGKASAHIGTRLLLDPMWTLRTWNAEWKKAQWGNAATVSSRFAADVGP